MNRKKKKQLNQIYKQKQICKQTKRSKKTQEGKRFEFYLRTIEKEAK
jgi:hypothetical protein